MGGMASEKEEQWKMMDVGVEGRELPDGDCVYQNAKHGEKHRETAKKNAEKTTKKVEK